MILKQGALKDCDLVNFQDDLMGSDNHPDTQFFHFFPYLEQVVQIDPDFLFQQKAK